MAASGARALCGGGGGRRTTAAPGGGSGQWLAAARLAAPRAPRQRRPVWDARRLLQRERIRQREMRGEGRNERGRDDRDLEISRSERLAFGTG